MAIQLNSPGVFTREIDNTRNLNNIPAEPGPAVVGPTLKGPALVPTLIRTIDEYRSIFGDGELTDTYVPELVSRHLAYGENIMVTRLLYEDGYSLTGSGLMYLTAMSGSTEYVTHVFHPTRPVTNEANLWSSASIADNKSGSFAITLNGHNDTPGYTAALDPSIGFDGSFAVTDTTPISGSIANNPGTKDLEAVFGSDPRSNKFPIYQFAKHPTASTLFNNIGHVSMSLQTGSYVNTNDYKAATTPWITSQKNSSGNTTTLFKFHTLSHGTAVNYETKIAIKDIKLGSETADPLNYGTFTVQIRTVNSTYFKNTPFDSDDTDLDPDAVETFTNVNLNPKSPDYIERRIGNQYYELNANNQIKLNGTYANNSRYVRVEVNTGIKNGESTFISKIPFGNKALSSPVADIVSPLTGTTSINLAPITDITTQDNGTGYIEKLYHGFDYTKVNNLNYLAPIPTTGESTGSNSDFYLGDVTQHVGADHPTPATAYSGSLEDAIVSGSYDTNIKLTTRRFVVPFQRGFDGAKPNLKKYYGQYIVASNTFGFDCSTSTSTGTKSYNKAISTLSDQDFYDIDMLYTPGIIDYYHPNVTSHARNMVRTRQDVFYVMDLHIDGDAGTNKIETTPNQVINYINSKNYNNNYTAVYWPWIQINNGSKGLEYVPPSIGVAGAIAFNDSISAPWYAPAGLNRGGLIAAGTSTTLTQQNRDDLYNVRINPIANFPNNGVCIWGQKTLQDLGAGPNNALTRVNVRRLLITVKKYISSVSKFIVFDQNNSVTRERFLNIVNPYLQQVKAQQGLNAFTVVMDGTAPTAYSGENVLYGKIALQPTRTAEFIVLDFSIEPTGATFPE